MSPSAVIAVCRNRAGEEVVLIQQGNTYMVGPKDMFQKECKHDEGFTFSKDTQQDLYGYNCNCGCGFQLSFSPDQYPAGVAHIEHQPSPEDKAIRLSKGGEK